MKKYLYRIYKWITRGIPVLQVPARISTVQGHQRLVGRKILITGGSRGIGHHIARRLIADGAEVLIVGRNLDALQNAAKQLNCKYLQFDLNQTDALASLVAEAAEQLGGLNGLVNNAAICNIDHGFLNVSAQSYDDQFLTNVKSPFFLTQAFLRYAQDAKVDAPSVLFITSERGLYPDDAPYGMTKAAIGNIIAGLAHQFSSIGLHINAIAPGVVADTVGHPEVYDDLYLKNASGHRFILPEEIAEVAAFLMSDASACISGEIIPCNQANHYK